MELLEPSLNCVRNCDSEAEQATVFGNCTFLLRKTHKKYPIKNPNFVLTAGVFPIWNLPFQFSSPLESCV